MVFKAAKFMVTPSCGNRLLSVTKGRNSMFQGPEVGKSQAQVKTWKQGGVAGAQQAWEGGRALGKARERQAPPGTLMYLSLYPGSSESS